MRRTLAWVVLVSGVLVVAVGSLWLAQGSDLVHIDPVACTGDCAPIAGHQPRWQRAGAGAMLAGLILSIAAIRALRRRP